MIINRMIALFVGLCCFVIIAKKSEAQEEWTLLAQEHGVSISYKYAQCDMPMAYDQESVLLKVENTNDFDVLVDWDIYLWYNDKCYTCDGAPEYHRTEFIEAKKYKEGNCDVDCPQTYRLFSKFTDEGYKNKDNQLVLTNFSVENVMVTSTKEDKKN